MLVSSTVKALQQHRLAFLGLLALSLAGCSRPPTLPYDARDLGATGRCGQPSIAGCESLSPAGASNGVEEAAAPATPAPPHPMLPPKGGLRIVVSLSQQRLYAYREGILVATSPVSTGKPGHATPVGIFHITQKQVFHRSNKDSNAPMPYMERLTTSGIALHAGHLPGYPASHGCIRLPMAFAKRLYGMTSFGTPVTVTRARERSAPHTFG